jgi:hypothetical protein
MTRLVALVLSLALALPAQAGDEQRRRNAAWALGLGALVAGIVAAETARGQPRRAPAGGGGDVMSTYAYAIYPCVDQARSATGRFDLSAVRRIEVSGRDTTVLLDGRVSGGSARVSCRVRDGRVVGFGFV